MMNDTQITTCGTPKKIFSKLMLLARRSKPKSLGEYVGHSEMLRPGKELLEAISSPVLPSLVVYGPSGIGKTTISRLLAQKKGYRFAELDFYDFGRLHSHHKETFDGVLQDAVKVFEENGTKTALLLDEIHRATRDQQAKVVEALDKGAIVVVGTTVFKPDKYLIPSLAALIKEIPLMMHGPEELRQILHHVLADREHGLGDLQVTVDADAENLLCSSTDGNAKIMLRFLEREVFRQIAFH